jgi:hypothetical protein
LAAGAGVGVATFSGAVGGALGWSGLDVGVGAAAFSAALGSVLGWSGLDVDAGTIDDGTVAVAAGGG